MNIGLAEQNITYDLMNSLPLPIPVISCTTDAPCTYLVRNTLGIIDNRITPKCDMVQKQCTADVFVGVVVIIDFSKDAAFTTGGTIRLSAEVTANAAVIASGDVQNAPGNNTLALALGALRDDTGMAALQARMGANFATQIGFASGESYGDHYSYSVTNLGVQAADARNQYEVYDTLAMQSENRRSSVSGVSIDDELTLMLRHQQAYTAASRLVKAADEMAQTILNMI